MKNLAGPLSPPGVPDAKLTKLYTDSCKQSVETFSADTEMVIQDSLIHN